MAHKTKVYICHLDDEGVYQPKSVSENALVAHLAHGDVTPGQAVPGKLGWEFASDCSVVATWIGQATFDILGSIETYDFVLSLTLLPDDTLMGYLQYTTGPVTEIPVIEGWRQGDDLIFRAVYADKAWEGCTLCVISDDGTHLEGDGDDFALTPIHWTANR